MSSNKSKDLFIRRAYTHNGVTVVVEIDFIKKEVSLVEKNSDNSFSDKRWIFTQRGRKYLGGWLYILKAMEHAVKEANKVLRKAETEDEQEFADLMLALSDKSLDYSKSRKKK